MLQRFFSQEDDPKFPPKRSAPSPDKRKNTFKKDIGDFSLQVISYARPKTPGLLLVKLYHNDNKIGDRYLRSESSAYASKLYFELSDLLMSAYRKDGTQGVYDSLEGIGTSLGIGIQEETPITRAFDQIKKRRALKKRQ